MIEIEIPDLGGYSLTDLAARLTIRRAAMFAASDGEDGRSMVSEAGSMIALCSKKVALICQL
ncbi:hypothetical protein [Actinoallomurus sp. CA-150999]|uniref:hypothetical protein n=1 Tax=Actinoallomurus sp. CA-150999 TaxID=3239887 RepID=UPI003D94FAB3